MTILAPSNGNETSADALPAQDKIDLLSRQVSNTMTDGKVIRKKKHRRSVFIASDAFSLQSGWLEKRKQGSTFGMRKWQEVVRAEEPLSYI